MAKPKITTYTVTGSGAIINTGEAVAANYIQLNGSNNTTFVLQADTLKSAITLKGNNTIYVEGNLADYQFSQKAKTVTMIDGDHTYSFTLSTMTSSRVVTTTMVFLDGQITMSNASRTNKVSLRGLDDDGTGALNQELTKTPTDVKINADSANITAATFFSDETKAADAAEAAAILDVQNTAYANAVVEVYQAAHKEAEKAQEQAIEADNNYQTAAAGVIDNQTASVAEALAEISLAAAARYEVAAAQEKEAAVELTAAAAATTSTVDNAVAALANLLADAAVLESGVYVDAATADVATAEQVILDVAEQTGYEEDFALDAVVMDYAYDATVAAQEDALAAEADYDVAEADVTDIASAQVAVAFAHISDEAADRNVAAATAEQWAAQELTASAALTGNVVDIKAAAIATYVANENAAAAAAIKVDTLQQIVDADQLLLDVTEQTGYEEEFALAGEIMKGAYAETVRAQEDALAAEADYDVAEAAVTCIPSANVAVALAHIADEAADRYLAAAIQEQVVAQALTDAAEATGIDVFIEAAAIATQVADQAVEAAEAIKVDTLQQIVDADQILVDVTIQEGYEADFAVDVELNKYAFDAAEKAQDEAKTAEANYDVGEAAVTDISSAEIAVALAHIADEAADNFVAVAAQEQAAAALLTASAALTGNAEYIKGAAVATYAANLNVTAAAAIKVDTLQQIVDADQILVEATALTAAERVEYFAELTAAHALTAYDHAEDETHEVLMVAEELNLNYEYYQPAVNNTVSAAQAKVLADYALEAANVWVAHAAEETEAAAALKLATDATLDPTDDAAADAAVADALADTAEAQANLVVATANEAQAVADVALYPAPPAPVVNYVLTTNPDTFVGTVGNDLFDGSALNTLSAFDNLTGGAGTNSLIANLTGGALAAGMTIQNIQSATIQTTNGGFVANLSTWTGLTSATISVAAGGLVSITAASTTAASIVGIDSGVDVIGGGGALVIVETGVAAGDDINVGQTAVANALTSVSVTGGEDALIRDRSGTAAATGSTLTSVSLIGNTGVINTITANGLTTLNITNQVTAAQVNTVTAAAATRALTVNLNGVVGVTGAGNTISVADNTATTVTIRAITAASSFVTASATSAATINIAAAVALSLDALTGANGTTTAVGLSGAGAIVIAADTLDAAVVITSTNTGGVTLTQALTANQQFVGTASSGNDVISVATSFTKAITTGAGNDTVNYGGPAATGGSIDAGTGTADTLVMTGAQAAAATLTTTFAATVANFEVLSLSAATALARTINMANADGINNLSIAGATVGALTVTNAAANFTLTQRALTSSASTVALAVDTGLSDNVNLVYTAADGFTSSATFTIGNVEQLTITTTDTNTTAQTALIVTPLTATSAATVTVAGNMGISFIGGLTQTTLTSLDASGLTASGTYGGLTWTAGALAASSTIHGGAAGTNIVIFSAANTASTFVTYIGGTGADTITGSNGLNNVVTLGDGTNSFTSVGAGNNTITGGSGVDTITVGSGGNTISTAAGNDIIHIGASAGLNNVNVGTGTDTVILDAIQTASGYYTSVTGMGAGDVVDLSNVTGSSAAVSAQTSMGAAIVLASTSAFADYLNAACAGDGATANTIISWFQYQGNTYVVEDTTNTGTFFNGADTVISLVGAIDLSSSTLAAGVMTIV